MARKAPGKKFNAEGIAASDSPAQQENNDKNLPNPLWRKVSKTGIEEERIPAEVVPISSELDRWIKQQGRDLRLRQCDRQVTVKLVNNLIKDLLMFLKENKEQPFFKDVSVLNTGSYYEFVKINAPNEFDIMLKLKTPRLKWKELEEYKGLFYTLSLSRPTRTEIRSFLLDDECTISANKIMKKMQYLVKKFVNTLKVSAGEGRWVVCRMRINSPAVTLAYVNEDDRTEIMSVDIVPALEVPQGWPLAARGGPFVDNWLGKNMRQKILSQPIYFVPKRPKKQKLSEVEKESWRISFSHIEKEIIRFHGNKKTCCESRQNECCRKLCLRLLKRLFEGLKQTYPKELKHLCSYHGKTAFFHHLSVRSEDSMWTPGQLSDCFMKLLSDFEQAAHLGSLPHFFVPDYNLFCPPAFPKRSLLFLTKALRNQMVAGLPLLQIQGPPLALCYTPALSPQLEEISPKDVSPQTACQTSLFNFSCAALACFVFFVAIACAFYARI